MRFLKTLFFLIILISSLQLGSGASSSNINEISPDQNTLVVSYNTTEMTIYRNETGAIMAEVSLDGSPQSGAYFVLTELNYDLGETVQDYNNGSYLIQFIQASNDNIVSGNYSIDIIAIYDTLNTSTPFEFNLLSYDTIIPQLEVITPVSGETYTTYMYLNLTGYDETEWREFRVDFRDQRIFTLFQIEEENGRGVWNATHLNLSTYIFFEALQGSNTIELTLIDTSYNSITITRNSVGDALPPSIEFVQPFDGSVTTDRTITLEWIAFDNEGIDSFELRVNNIPIGTYGSQVRSATEFIAIPEDEVTQLTFRIFAFDSSGNTNSSQISVTYDPNFITINPEVERQNELRQLVVYVIVTVMAIFAIGLGISLYRSLKSNQTKNTQISEFKTRFPRNDLVEIFRLNIADETIKENLIALVESFQQSLKNLSKSKVKEKVANLRENIIKSIENDEVSDDLESLVTIILENWMEQYNITE